jgi:hypothetical protein
VQSTIGLFVSVAKWCLRHIIVLLAFAALLAAFLLVEGPHETYRQETIDFSKFAVYWIGLGIASSIGFGTGLHTFILYLGPHIA